MRTKWKMVAAGVAAIGALSTGTALYAQADKPKTGSGMMMHESGDMMGMMGMMGMMAQMNQMMEACNKMMQDMGLSMGADKHSPPQKSK